MSVKRKKIHPFLKSFIPIVKVIAGMFGRNCEVVLHDLSRPEHSIIAIENGHVTGRDLGDPITDFALNAWQEGGFGNNKEDQIIGYKNKTKDRRILKSSSMFIRDDKENIIGCLCINYDITGYLMFEKIMNEFCNLTELNEEKEEKFVKNIDKTLEDIINEAIEEINKPLSLMQKEDNLRVVEIVDEKGGFKIKGAINLLAHRLNVSRYTIYNYLDELKVKKERSSKFII